MKGHAGQVAGIAFAPDGKTIASASEDKTVRIWDIAQKKEIGPSVAEFLNGQ